VVGLKLGEIEPWMRKAEPFIYARISSQEQVADEAKKPILEQTPIKDQIAGIQLALKKEYGLKQAKKAHIFADLASGNSMDRPAFNAFMEAILNHKGRTFVALSEPSRWSRNITLGEEAYAPLYRRNIPKLITSDGTISHTSKTPRTNEQAMMSMKAIFAQAERGQLIERVNRKKRALISQGILPAGIGSLFPFARQDPLKVLLDNVSLIDVPVKEGGGGSALGRLIVSATAPYGPTSQQWYKRALQRQNKILAKLNADELEEYMAFRDKIRAIQLDRDYDSSRDKPIASIVRTDVDWGLKALQRFANGYLKEPYNPQYRMPTDEEIKEYLTNPKEYLSDNDKRLYRRLVSKR
jgi:DNA invertase Pin-like site-specific DNA recombinase